MTFKIIFLFLRQRKIQFRITQQNFLAAFSSGKNQQSNNIIYSHRCNRYLYRPANSTTLSKNLESKPWPGGHEEKAAHHFNSNGLWLLICYGKENVLISDREFSLQALA